MTSVAVVGSVNLDIVARVDRLPLPGETVTGADLARYPGGKGANQALAARRLGADVSLVACVGDDSSADEAMALLEDDGVDLAGCRWVPGAATGTALIAVAASGENHIVVAPGANRLLSSDDVRDLAADALICQLEVPADIVATTAATFSGFFSINLAPAMKVDAAVLQRADLLVVNEGEARWYGETLASCRGIVAITRGAGIATLERDGRVIAEARPPTVAVVDTTGAGDAFTAALTLALVEGAAADEALGFACAAGAAATMHKGAQPSLPSRAAVLDLIRRA